MVDTDEKGFKSVEYSKLVALLLEAIKDQQKLISKQESDIAALKSETEKAAHMQSEINEIKALLKKMDIAKDMIANNK